MAKHLSKVFDLNKAAVESAINEYEGEHHFSSLHKPSGAYQQKNLLSESIVFHLYLMMTFLSQIDSKLSSKILILDTTSLTMKFWQKKFWQKNFLK